MAAEYRDEKMDETNRNKTVKVIIVVITLLVISLGVTVFVINKYNQYINNTAENGGLAGLYNALMSFLGAIIGGLSSLLGIAWTIEFTSKQNKEDKELQIRPYFDIRSSSMLKKNENDHFLGYIRLSIEDQEEYNEMKTGQTRLIINNIGLGTAINLDFHISVNHNDAKHNEWFTNGNSLVDANAIAVGDRGIIELRLFNKVPEITEENHLRNENLNAYTHKKALDKLPKDFSFSVDFEYQDLLANWFTQKLDFNVHYLLDNKKICGDIVLRHINSPVKKRR